MNTYRLPTRGRAPMHALAILPARRWLGMRHIPAEHRHARKVAMDAWWHRTHRATGRPSGRPRNSSHPRAEYWRMWCARRRAMTSN